MQLLEQYQGYFINQHNERIDRHTMMKTANDIAQWICSNIQPGCKTVGLLAMNSPAWIAVDLACAQSGLSLVPLPDFFTDDQLLHLTRQAGISLLLSDNTDRTRQLGFMEKAGINTPEGAGKIGLFGKKANNLVDLEDVQKVTFTSGTTAAPKGVCLTALQQLNTAKGLVLATQPIFNTYKKLLLFINNLRS